MLPRFSYFPFQFLEKMSKYEKTWRILTSIAMNIRVITYQSDRQKESKLIQVYERWYRDVKQAKRFMDGSVQARIRDTLSLR